MQRFQDAIERARATGNADGVIALLADDVVFRSPVVHTPYHGRDDVAPLLHAVVRVFERFRFVRRIGAPGGADHALVIDEFAVMVRPLSGALALAEAMQRALAPED
jgi:ketosteroid isomerase-like protein